ncbi:unnamed protein product [Adineta steineri]|uniref:SAP domain-containing protein n=1 Tax=Adineta steineri TaxID=433720 RepID=A0A815FNL8_9BILA|nr:unnamed protein product [Adineta steineri]CAF1328086.1 unnamed protein product [Adineta steineri]
MIFNNHNNVNGLTIIKENNSFQQQINQQSLTQDLEQSRESLKRKLQIRRSFQQLVDVGIIPLSFYEQQKQVQMQKTQDILKNKILSRPDRQLLIEHNILSDTIAAPAIQNTQRQLKRARLVDNLNDKLSVRPGILELVANNILEIDSNLQQAIQDGHIQYPSVSRPLHKKTSSFSSSTTIKRPLNSISKSKSCLTFHEYKGPSQKAEVTKVPLQFEYSHYDVQLRQQQLFLELIHTNKTHTIENLFQQSFETMKLADLKNVCRKLNISSTGTKIKLIEKLKNAQLKMSDTTNGLSQLSNTSLPTIKLLLSTSSLNDRPQQLNSFELENQFSLLAQSNNNSTTTQKKCNSVQKQILIQQHPNVSLTPESVAQFLVQSQTSCESINNNIILNQLDEYFDSTSSLPIDYMEISNIVDNNTDFTQFLNDQHHMFFDSFDLFSPSNSMI